jgi:hypothetical protein
VTKVAAERSGGLLKGLVTKVAAERSGGLLKGLVMDCSKDW